MNRREAVKALMGLSAVATITVAQVSENDVLVVECDGAVTIDQAKRIKATIEELWPGRRALVCPGNVRVKVMKGTTV